MAPNPRRLDARLQSEVYDLIPKIVCQGLCHDACGPIGTSYRERDRIERASGRTLTCGAGATCSMLTEDRRCSVYELRPLICRLWGVIESLPCHYGCRPERFLSDKEGWELVLKAEQIGGTDRTRQELQQAVKLLRSMTPEQVRALARSFTPEPRLEARDRALPPTVLHRDPKRR